MSKLLVFLALAAGGAQANVCCSGGDWNAIAADAEAPTATCGGRITWLQDNRGVRADEACSTVAGEFPDVCGSCGAEMPGSACDAQTKELTEENARLTDEVGQLAEELEAALAVTCGPTPGPTQGPTLEPTPGPKNACGQPCVPIVLSEKLTQDYNVKKDTCVDVVGDLSKERFRISIPGPGPTCAKVTVKSTGRIRLISVAGTNAEIVVDGELDVLSVLPTAVGAKVTNRGSAVGGGPVSLFEYTVAGSDITVSFPGVAEITVDNRQAGEEVGTPIKVMCYGDELDVPWCCGDDDTVNRCPVLN